MTSEALEKFRRSLTIGYEQWHDGLGYDLDALGALEGDELKEVEDLLLSRRAADSRDLEALDHIGSVRALDALRRALLCKSVDARVEAAQRLAVRGLLSEAEISAIIVAALATTTVLDGMVKTLAFAAAHPSPLVRSKLLDRALRGNDDIRIHAAALSHFLHGRSSSAFDDKFRAFYHRFGSRDRNERRAAYRELCGMIGATPED